MPSRPTGARALRLVAALSALIVVVVLAVSSALPQSASAATVFTRTALTTTMTATATGATVTVKTSLQASKRTAASAVGVCVRSAAGANVDFAKRAATLSSTPTGWSGTRTFAPGRYVDYACVKVDGTWHRVGAKGSFTVPAPKAGGKFTPVIRETFSTAAPAGTVHTRYARSLAAYEDNAKYRRANLSVHDGVLDLKLTRTTGAAVVLGPPDSLWGRRYGRFEVTFTVQAASGQGAAVMLWPTSNLWSDGEIDFPEGNFDGPIQGFHHPTPCGYVDGGRLPHCGSADAFVTQASWRSWHTASIEWVPGAVRYRLDGRLLRTITHDVPTTDHRFTIQSAPEGRGGKPGHLLISSYAIAAWSR